MGLTSQLANLQGIYGQGTSQLEQSRLAALADLASRVSGNRIAATQASTSRDQTIQDALAALLGTGYIPPTTTGGGTTDGGGTTTGGGTEPTTAAAKPTALQQLLNVPVKASNTALIKRIADFAAAKPNASAAAVAKEFPQLAAAAKKKK
jgi:hypothetical protein